MRKDALLGMAEFAIQATRLVASGHEEAMVTIGKVGGLPGSFSIVLRRADL